MRWQLICNIVWYKLTHVFLWLQKNLIVVNWVIIHWFRVWICNSSTPPPPPPPRLIFLPIGKVGARCDGPNIFQKPYGDTQILPFFETKQNKTMLHYLPWRSFKSMTPVLLNVCGLKRLRYTQRYSVFTKLGLAHFHRLRGMKGIRFYRTFKCFRGNSKYNHFRFTTVTVSGVIFGQAFLQQRKRREFHYQPE